MANLGQFVMLNQTRAATASLRVILSETWYNVFGSSDTVDMNSGDAVGTYGGGNLINGGADETIVVGNTGTDTDRINASGDGAGGTVSNGDQTGIALSGSDQVTVDGNNDHIAAASNDKISVDGNSDAVTGNGSDDVNFDGSNDQGYGTDDSSGGSSGSGGDGGYGYYGYDFVGGAKDKIAQGIEQIASYDSAQNATSAPTADATSAAKLVGLESAAAAADNSSNTSTIFEGARWSSDVITWSVGSGSAFSSQLTSGEEADIEKAFKTWADSSGLTFVEVADSAQADIRVGLGDFDPASTGVLGYASGLYRAAVQQASPGGSKVAKLILGCLKHSACSS